MGSEQFGQNHVINTIGELLVRVGIYEKAELRIGVNSYAVSRIQNQKLKGFEDFELGFKIKMNKGSEHNQTGMPHFALVTSTTMPKGSSNFRSNRLQPAVKFISAMDITDKISVGSNINYEYLNEDNGQFSQLVGSIQKWTMPKVKV